MLLQRCTNKARFGTVLVAMLIFAGCGGKTALRDTTTPQQSAGSGSPTDSNVPTPAIPPLALTLFEQATAVMASGDFLEAELRFKEFLLQFPSYPGAHVNLAIIHANNSNDDAARASLDAA